MLSLTNINHALNLRHPSKLLCNLAHSEHSALICGMKVVVILKTISRCSVVFFIFSLFSFLSLSHRSQHSSAKLLPRPFLTSFISSAKSERLSSAYLTYFRNKQVYYHPVFINILNIHLGNLYLGTLGSVGDSLL